MFSVGKDDFFLVIGRRSGKSRQSFVVMAKTSSPSLLTCGIKQHMTGVADFRVTAKASAYLFLCIQLARRAAKVLVLPA